MIKKKWDMFAESVSMSLSNIAGNKMRTFLTTLGIIIGVGAIIALMTVVQGATDTMNAQFDAMGLGTLRVSVTGTAIKHGLTDDDLQTILDCEHVAGISPSLNATVTAKRGNVWSDSISVNGNNDEYFRHNPGSGSDAAAPSTCWMWKTTRASAWWTATRPRRCFSAKTPSGRRFISTGLSIPSSA